MNRHIILISVILVAVGCFIMQPIVMAQQFTPPTPESRVNLIKKAVTLTQDQETQILKIYQDAATNAQSGGGGGRGGGFGGANAATIAAVEKILTPDQVKKWRAFTLQQSVDARITQIDTAVTLTADQKKKITPIIEKEINATNALTAGMQAQGQNADFQAMREKTTALRAATDKALETILTPEQLTKYQAMPRGGGGGRGGRGGRGGNQ